jgi:hypothetical protein
MQIYSTATASAHYSIALPQIGKDYWTTRQEIAEAKYLPTSTTSAGVFRQITKYDVTSITKSYQVIATETEAAMMLAMHNSTQTEWIVDNGSARYKCSVSFGFGYLSRDKTRVSADIAVIEAL